MDALILCGGFATRLEPITFFVPKPLLPVGGKPILDHIVDSVKKAGAKRIVLSTNKKFYDQFRYWSESAELHGIKGGVEIVMEPTMNHGEKYGAIKGINYAIEKLGLDGDLMVIAGDNFYTFGLDRITEKFTQTRKTTIAVHDVKSLDDARRFGVVDMKNDRVVGFEEKPKSPKSSLISTGIYVFPKEMLGMLKEYVSGGNNPDAPGYFLQWLMKKDAVYGVVYTDNWYDIGTVETYKEVFDRYVSRQA